MVGFFTKQELDRFSNGKSLLSKESNCYTCKLYKGCKHPKMDYTGDGRLKCLIIAEAPAKVEDDTGIQLKGDVGQYFRGKLDTYNLDLDKDFWKINAVNCWPRNKNGTTRTPTKAEIKFCKPKVDDIIDKLKPEHIWLMGGAALQSFYYGEFTDCSPTRWRGLSIPDQKTGAWISPIFHPSYPRRSKHINQNIVSVYNRDLKNAVQRLQKRTEFISFDKTVIYHVYKYDALISLLDRILNQLPPELFIDYEATGLKPYKKGHKIVSISLAYKLNEAHSFPLSYRNHWTTEEFLQIRKKIRQILKHPKIKKQAHNFKFEHNWAKEILGVTTAPWNWCSMNVAHILDNRRKYTNLNFQTYINFGILPYDKKIDSFKKSIVGDFNRMESVPLDELLEYGGFDSLYGFHLVQKQKKEAEQKKEGDFKQAYGLFHEGLIEFAKIESTGININEKIYNEGGKDLQNEINDLETKINNSKEVAKFKELQGRSINLNSNQDLGILIYDILGAKKLYTNDKNINYRVNEDALQTVKFPFTENLLRLKKLDKVLNTYLAQFKKRNIDGKLHPSFDLHIPITYRPSSSAPNFTNIPVRDFEASKYCRSGIIPSKGNKLLESDFKGIEVSTGTCYHKDPKMIIYNTDETTDMHRDMAQDLWILPEDEITDDIRFYAKNDWVFAEFYGSWFKECARCLWADCINLKTKNRIPLKQHLIDKKINSLNAFIEHCKGVEQNFWNVRFKGYKQWKEENNVRYIKQGYLETFLGFVLSGLMTFNEVCNYQIQGTAFHLLLWTLIEVMRIKEEEKWESNIIGQIYDSMLIDCVPSEEKHITDTINYIGTVKIRAEFNWIIVPLKIDFAVSEIDGNWFDMKKKNTNGDVSYMDKKYNYRPARRRNEFG